MQRRWLSYGLSRWPGSGPNVFPLPKSTGASLKMAIISCCQWGARKQKKRRKEEKEEKKGRKRRQKGTKGEKKGRNREGQEGRGQYEDSAHIFFTFSEIPM